MKIDLAHDHPSVPWDDQKDFPDRIVSGSPEHQGAHLRLLELTVAMETDFEPYGKRYRDDADCSCGCRHYAILAGPLGADWGVCMNRRSPRAGLLTFEHQGCPEFEDGPEIDLEAMGVPVWRP